MIEKPEAPEDRPMADGVPVEVAYSSLYDDASFARKLIEEAYEAHAEKKLKSRRSKLTVVPGGKD